MSNPIKLPVFILVSAALLVDVGFIPWATKLNFLIVVPAVLGACYLFYLAARYTILNFDEEDKSSRIGVGVQETRPRVHELGGESPTSRTQPVTQGGGDVAYRHAKAS